MASHQLGEITNIATLFQYSRMLFSWFDPLENDKHMLNEAKKYKQRFAYVLNNSPDLLFNHFPSQFQTVNLVVVKGYAQHHWTVE